MTFIRRFFLAFSLVLLALAPAHAAGKALERTELSRLADQLDAEFEASSDPRPFDQLVKDGVAQIRRNDWRAAAETFGFAIASDPKSEQAWRNYAVALLRITPKDYNERTNFPERAAAAAYRTYELSPDPRSEARALAILGEAESRREQWRDALNAYRQSLALNDAADVRATYQKLRAERGFRVLDYSVDSDAASPRVCVQFSEELSKAKLDFAPFVRFSASDKPAVTASGAQLCVDGLEHGKQYELTVRQGLPSDVQEDLLADKDLSVYVRDRKPMVRFTGRNYVLPRTGQQGLPLVTVNLDKVAVEILRVGDRNLAPAVVGGDFQRQLDNEQIGKLRRDTGAVVFNGTMEVEKRLNQDVTTAFPIDATVKTLQPGVYVMIASDAATVDPEYSYEAKPTQWFVVSDLGLTAVKTESGIHVITRSLADAKPMEGVELSLIARNNEVLGTAKTDKDGHARFDGALARGEGGLEAAVLMAAMAGDYGFLNLTQPAFDLTDRGVAGRAAPGPLEAMVFTERGVYRPGEVVHLTTLLRDANANAVANLPLTLVVYRPDGTEDRRMVLADQGAGGRVLDLPVLDTAVTGRWSIKAYSDAKRPPVGETTFLVEDYVPERLELKLATKDATMGPQGISVDVEGRWLYGAPAAELRTQGSVTIRAAAAAPAGFGGYRFGLADETISAESTALEDTPATDDNGKATLSVPRPKLPAATKPLEALVAVSLVEPSGRALERTLTVPVRADKPLIGVRPLFDGALGEGEVAGFDVRVLGPDGRPVAAKGLRWELSRLDMRYQWFSQNGRWDYQTVSYARRQADGRVDVNAADPARITAKVDYGRYRLDVTSEDGRTATSVEFSAGWFESASADTPDILEVALDKPNYKAGDTATLKIAPRFAGRATVMVVGQGVIDTKVVDVGQDGASVPLSVTEAWRPGAYVVAFLHRPLDAAASRMPGRAIGVVHAAVDNSPRIVGVSIGTGEKAQPRGPLRVPLKLANLASGEEAFVTVAAVDVGILNLTRFESPAPEKIAFAQRKLAADIRDLYGQLIDGMRAQRGRVRTGGDGAGANGMKDLPTQPPLAFFSGLVKVGADGAAEVVFDLPAFNGTVRLMAIAWTKDKLGHAEKDVVVADPVVVTATLPRFLAVGDRSRLRLDFDNVSGAAGAYRVGLALEGGTLQAASAEQTVQLAQRGRGSLAVPVTGAGTGRTALTVKITGPDGQSYDQRLTIDVKPAYPEIATRTMVQLAPRSGSVSVGPETVRDFVDGTAQVAISVGPRGSLDPAVLVTSLETYPWSCSEQLSSRLTALLYADELGVPLPPDAKARGAQMIARILSRQGSAGGFGLWSAPFGSEDLWLDSYVTDVLTRARERGFEVPDRALASALDRLRNSVGLRNGNDAVSDDVAYAHYVLARNGRAMVGDLRYLADTKLTDFKSPMARAQIAAALAAVGDRARSARAFEAADAVLAGKPDNLSRQDYGTHLRDGAGVLALSAEANASVVQAVARRVDAERNARSYLSTQENAWLLRAARALKAESDRLALIVDGQPFNGALNRSFRGRDLERTLTVSNPGQDVAVATITARGAPRSAPPAAESGLRLERTYYSMAGEVVDPATVKQNTRLIVVLRVSEVQPQTGRLLVVDNLPAGFEIENPRLLQGSAVSLDFLPEEPMAEHSEFRDDRFVAAFNRTGESDDAIAAYIVRAVSPGSFVLPPATAEDMYRPQRFARTPSGRVEVTEAR